MDATSPQTPPQTNKSFENSYFNRDPNVIPAKFLKDLETNGINGC